MSNILPFNRGAERAPDSPEAGDRIIFSLSESWALGLDPLQWMLMRARNRRGQREWRPVSFIASEKRILERCLAENGIQPTPEARAKLDALPDTFKQWIAEQKRDKSAQLKTWRKFPAGFFTKPLPGLGLRLSTPIRNGLGHIYSKAAFSRP